MSRLLVSKLFCRRSALAGLIAMLGAAAALGQDASPALFDPPDQSYHASDAVEFELERSWTSRTIEGGQSLLEKIGQDHKNFYDRDTLKWLLAGVGAHAVIANTNIDEFLREEYQQNVRNADTDEWSEFFHGSKFFGEGVYVLPTYTLAAIVGTQFDEDSPAGKVGEWGSRSLRTVLVGAPPLLALQVGIGASRPMEEHSQSHWEPLQDDNGASGHAFMGAVPFLSAARMTERPGLRAALYVGSTMPGISRINDDAHYTSQVILGWTVAYLASAAVDDTERSEHTPHIYAGPVADGEGVSMMWEY